MNGTLHELVRIHTYWYDKKVFSKIYFGGRLTSYATVYPDELLGDLLYLFQNISSIDLQGILNNQSLKLERCGNEYIRIDNQYVLEVAAVIAECYPHMEQLDWEGEPEIDIIDKIEAMVDIMEKKRIRLSKECVEAFVTANGLYVPPKTRILDCEALGENELLDEELSFLQYEKADDFLLALKNDGKNTVYCYECDVLDEIIISLLQSIALKNTTIKRCKVCGRVFATQNRTDEKYCYRFSKDCTCKTIGKKAARSQRMRTANIVKRYNAINTNLANRINATKIQGNKEEIEVRRNILYTFRNLYQEKKQLLSEDQLMEWMDEFLANAREGSKQ